MNNYSSHLDISDWWVQHITDNCRLACQQTVVNGSHLHSKDGCATAARLVALMSLYCWVVMPSLGPLSPTLTPPPLATMRPRLRSQRKHCSRYMKLSDSFILIRPHIGRRGTGGVKTTFCILPSPTMSSVTLPHHGNALQSAIWVISFLSTVLQMAGVCGRFVPQQKQWRWRRLSEAGERRSKWRPQHVDLQCTLQYSSRSRGKCRNNVVSATRYVKKWLKNLSMACCSWNVPPPT